MSATAIDLLEAPCKDLAQRLSREWGWDSRLSTLLLAFPHDDTAVPTALLQVLGEPWSARTIGSAPQRVQALAAKFGLDSGQSLLTLEQNGATLFAAVWPWGNGKTVSLRLGFSAPDLADPDKAAADVRLKSWFGVR